MTNWHSKVRIAMSDLAPEDTEITEADFRHPGTTHDNFTWNTPLEDLIEWAQSQPAGSIFHAVVKED